MTRYDPVADARDDGDLPAPLRELRAGGYDDPSFRAESAQDALTLIIGAMREAGAAGRDDTATWRAANDLLEAALWLDREHGLGAEVDVEVRAGRKSTVVQRKD